MKNKILITMGDPAGIGPEIILKFYKDFFSKSGNNFIPVVVGDKEILKYYIGKYNLDLKVEDILGNYKNREEIKNIISKNIIPIINVEHKTIDENIAKAKELEIGIPTKQSGKMSMLYIEKALELTKDKTFDAMVTAPISKEAINLAGYHYSGHTSFLADNTNTKNYAMILKGDKITVVLNTTHLSLNDAIKKVKKENILKKIKLANKAKKLLGIKTKIAVSGLNPHNGEGGLFGDEEIKEILPAVEEAKKLGIEVEGPIVPDTLFVRMLKDEFNIAVVMYHDQGLIPMKMESFGLGVNITVGLPIIRTSVDHGTAYDIAGKNLADYGSLKKAVGVANIIIENSLGMD
ncbi:4-hydroxythreonine-4-phosphate dehydrogenase PdxA [Haliovirga abyssi]|uniref:4-hydroxythreonine-4-phosphate dehydrogenase n=1 Tax=Haliovirga abyssi TaxID=2996794 RepID=A0AAU9DGU2_9FUSO|nr:4-hydroxythreonine-4-phosphate dehydrogenase PdxA [Haliovirga abyssi]BDU50677.1 4-hydroxythreonine-4-phosphate dehydrogenase [Haliovirga abyssi]